VRVRFGLSTCGADGDEAQFRQYSQTVQHVARASEKFKEKWKKDSWQNVLLILISDL
jgi:hypothetical protein